MGGALRGRGGIMVAGLARLGYLHKPLWTKCAQMTGADSMHVLWEWSNMTWQNTVERPIVFFFIFFYTSCTLQFEIQCICGSLLDPNSRVAGFVCFSLCALTYEVCCYIVAVFWGQTTIKFHNEWNRNKRTLSGLLLFFLHRETMSKPLTPLTVGQSN